MRVERVLPLLGFIVGVSGFLPTNLHISKCSRFGSNGRSRQLVQFAKGFGNEVPSKPNRPEPPKQKPPPQKKVPRTEAEIKFDEQLKAGVPEYAVFARLFGQTEQDWFPVGSVAVPRSEKAEDTIFGNEPALLEGIYQINPKLKQEEGKIEYGFRLKKFPDDPVRLAIRKTAGNEILKWFGSLTSPVNTDSYKAN